MINLTKIRELTLRMPSSPQRHPHLSAASGLVRAGAFLYVVADDEYHLGVFPADGDAAGELIPLFPGELPASRKERKAHKPDLEVLTRLPPFPGYPAGALFALASGSRRNRRTGVLLPLDTHGAVIGAPRLIDLSGVFDLLELQFSALNIEGAVATGNKLRLLQRGNKQHPQNACIRLHLPDVFQALVATDSMGTTGPVDIQVLDLGTIDGIPLCFSDGTALPDDCVIFTAIAENTENSYDDGPCAGAAIGIAGSDGRLRFLQRVDPGHKIEGIDAQVEGHVIRLLLVTDADDESIPACLLSAEIHGYPFASA